MNKPLPARLAELERLLIQQAEELRQKDTQLRLIEETEAFLRTALARAEEKVEEGEREIERLRASWKNCAGCCSVTALHNRITLYKVLGGGWNANSANPV